MILQALRGLDVAEQDFPQIVVNRLVVVDNEDPMIGRKQFR
jgi:hypothetical protein